MPPRPLLETHGTAGRQGQHPHQRSAPTRRHRGRCHVRPPEATTAGRIGQAAKQEEVLKPTFPDPPRHVPGNRNHRPAGIRALTPWRVPSPRPSGRYPQYTGRPRNGSGCFRLRTAAGEPWRIPRPCLRGRGPDFGCLPPGFPGAWGRRWQAARPGASRGCARPSRRRRCPGSLPRCRPGGRGLRPRDPGSGPFPACVPGQPRVSAGSQAGDPAS